VVSRKVRQARARSRPVAANYGSFLLPLGAPEGCPTHPSYGAGHATVAAACVRILKASFDESFVSPNPVVPDGLGLPERAIRVAK
jgi:hypothetical protein